MAYRYLIDGYNLLYALPDMPPGSWQEKRQQLISFLQRRRPQGNNKATVVFDSHQGLGDQMTENDLTIVYTAGETADDRISAMVGEASNPRILVVVSNDLGIRELVRGTGARFLSCEEFMKGATSPTRKTLPERSNSNTAQKITEEFKKKWL